VLKVALSARYAILDLHWNPSAGQGVVLNSRTLAFIGTFEGYAARELQDGVITHSGNTVHFAPTHQDRLFAFEPRLKRGSEIFPGPRESPIAVDYRRKVRAAYAQLPQASRQEFEESVYRVVEDFDREFGPLVDGSNGKTIAFVATYWSTRLDTVGRDTNGRAMPAPVKNLVLRRAFTRAGPPRDRDHGLARRQRTIRPGPP